MLWTDVRAFIGLASECENPGPHVVKYAANIVDEARALLGRSGVNIGAGIGDAIRLFEIARGDDVDLAVELPPSWAVEHDRVEVIFEDWEVCGWHAMPELPDPAPPGDGWDDLEQGWWASVRAVGDAVFIAETDFDRLLDVRGTPVASRSRRGHRELSGVPVIWSRVPRPVWDEAWSTARASCATGAPALSRAPRATGARRVER